MTMMNARKNKIALTLIVIALPAIVFAGFKFGGRFDVKGKDALFQKNFSKFGNQSSLEATGRNDNGDVPLEIQPTGEIVLNETNTEVPLIVSKSFVIDAALGSTEAQAVDTMAALRESDPRADRANSTDFAAVIGNEGKRGRGVAAVGNGAPGIVALNTEPNQTAITSIGSIDIIAQEVGASSGPSATADNNKQYTWKFKAGSSGSLKLVAPNGKRVMEWDRRGNLKCFNNCK